MTQIPGAVFDCNIFLQALAAPDGPAGRCVQLALDGEKINLFVSPAVLEEVADVATRPKVAARLRLTRERVERFLEAIEVAATVFHAVHDEFALDRDPDDAHYVNLACSPGASYVVTPDRDLLDLMDMATAAGRDFCRQFPTIRIVDPLAFLREIDHQR